MDLKSNPVWQFTYSQYLYNSGRNWAVCTPQAVSTILIINTELLFLAFDVAPSG